jgi:hypothetical protein
MSGTEWDGEPSEAIVPGSASDQSQSSAGRRRRGRVVAAAGAAAAVIIAAVVVALVVPKSSSPRASSGLSPTQIVTVAARNAARLNSVSATLTENVSGAASATITGKVTEQHHPLLLAMSIDENSGGTNIPISGIITAHTMYLKLGGTSLGMPAALAHKWIKIPLAQLGAGSAFATLMHSVQNANPMSQAQLLVAAEHLRAVGTQDVGGVSTTMYAGWFLPSAAVKHLAPSMRTALAPELKLITGKISISVWIDSQDQIRKLVEVEHVGSSTLTVVCTFDRFNQPVHITLPSASQVVTPAASALSAAA